MPLLTSLTLLLITCHFAVVRPGGNRRQGVLPLRQAVEQLQEKNEQLNKTVEQLRLLMDTTHILSEKVKELEERPQQPILGHSLQKINLTYSTGDNPAKIVGGRA